MAGRPSSPLGDRVPRAREALLGARCRARYLGRTEVILQFMADQKLLDAAKGVKPSSRHLGASA